MAAGGVAGGDQAVVQVAHRLLAGAQHDGVDLVRRGLAVDGDVHAVVVDAVVGHSAHQLHPGLLEHRPVGPAGGLAEADADGGVLALQQHHVAQRRARLGLGEPAGMHGRVADTPVGHPVVEAVGRVVDEEVRDVDADAARADHRHPPAGDDAPAQHVGVRRHGRVVDPLERRGARHDAGRHDHVVVQRQVGERRLDAEPHGDAEHLEPAAVVAQGLGEVRLAGHGHRQPELPADRVGLLEQRDREAALGSGDRGRESGRSGADDRDPRGCDCRAAPSGAGAGPARSRGRRAG